jgi:hypothetical protein
MGEEPVRIEILNWASGVHFEECYAERIIDNLDGVSVPHQLKGSKDHQEGEWTT